MDGGQRRLCGGAGATSYGLKEPLKYSYLKTGIASSETFHMYQTAHFIQFLVDAGYDFGELFPAVMNASGGALEGLNAYCATKSIPLATLYDQFAYQVIFENSVSTEALQGDVYSVVASSKLAMNLDTTDELSELVPVNASYAAALAGIQLTSDQDAKFTVAIKAIEPTSGVKVQYILSDGPGKDRVIETGYVDQDGLDLTVENGNTLYFLTTNYAPQNGSVTVVVNKDTQPQPYSNKRTVKFYNDTFLVDVDFNLVADAPFTISSEVVQGEGLYLVLDFVKGTKDITIEVEGLADNLRFATAEDWDANHQTVIKEMYWSTAAGDIPNSQTRLTIPASDPRIQTIGYSVVVDILNVEENHTIGAAAPRWCRLRSGCWEAKAASVEVNRRSAARNSVS